MAIILTTFKESLVYRFSMILSVIIGPLIFFVDFVIWSAIYQASGKMVIAGLNFDGMMTYLAVSLASSYLLYDNVRGTLSDRVGGGTLTMFILRPVDYLRSEFVHKIGHRSLAALIEFFPVLFIIGLFFGFNMFYTKNLLFYIIALAIAFTMSFLINGLLGIVAFWTVRPRAFSRIYEMILPFLTGGFFPLSLYPAQLQKIVALLPFQFIAYVPSRIFLGNYELGGVVLSPVEIILYGLLQIIILYGLLRLFWTLSIKKYCGVGQ